MFGKATVSLHILVPFQPNLNIFLKYLSCYTAKAGRMAVDFLCLGLDLAFGAFSPQNSKFFTSSGCRSKLTYQCFSING